MQAAAIVMKMVAAKRKYQWHHENGVIEEINNEGAVENRLKSEENGGNAMAAEPVAEKIGLKRAIGAETWQKINV
jgi:chemotaxis receptor (MCP) glutamine deamidase CheD